MMKISNGNGAVSLPAFVTIVSLLLAIMTFIFTQMVPRGEFELVCRRLDRIETKLDRALERRSP